jgi:hypothetical protein
MRRRLEDVADRVVVGRHHHGDGGLAVDVELGHHCDRLLDVAELVRRDERPPARRIDQPRVAQERVVRAVRDAAQRLAPVARDGAGDEQLAGDRVGHELEKLLLVGHVVVEGHTHPVLATALWSVGILVVFAPLAVRRYRRMAAA